MKRLAFFFAIILFSTVSRAALPLVGANAAHGPVAKLTAVAANAVAGTRTFTVANPEGQYGMLVVHANFTYNAATAVTFTCSESPDSGVTTFPLQDGTTSNGVQTLVDASKTKATGNASIKFPMRWDIKGFTYISCVYSTTGGGASDLMTATITLVAP